MDAFLTFLSNYYIWFLVAAGIFLFALIGLIIESSKKHKKEAENADNEEVGTVESFRSGASDDNTTNEESLDSSSEASSSIGDFSSIEFDQTPGLEDNGRSFEAPSYEANKANGVIGDTPSFDSSSISFETPSFDGTSDVEETPSTEDNSFEVESEPAVELESPEANAEEQTGDEITFETPSIDENVDSVSNVEEIPAPESPAFEIVDDVVDADSLDSAEETPKNETEEAPVDDMMSIPSLDNVPAFESVDVPDKTE